MKKSSVKIGLISILILTLSLVVTMQNPALASPGDPTISAKNPQTGTGNFIFYSNTTKVDSRFNVTVDINNGTDIASWQVAMTYNATLLNATRTWVPSTDTQYIFYGIAIFNPGTSFQAGLVKMGEVTLPAQNVSFTTTKKLAIIEFKVLAEPPKGIGNKRFSTLGINSTDTYILTGDENTTEIPSVKSDGYYELNWAPPASQISISANPTTVNIGQSVIISGTIATIPTNASVVFPNATVTIWHKTGTGAFANLTTAKTNSTSSYSYTWTSTGAGTHQFNASWVGNANYSRAMSNAVSVTVDKLSSTITLDANPASVEAGGNVTLSGTLNPPARSGETVTISIGNTNVTTTTGSNGAFSYAWKTTDAGTFTLKASWAGDATYKSAVSSSVTVDVTAPPMNWLYYVIAAIVVIIIIAAIVYYMRKRSKPQQK